MKHHTMSALVISTALLFSWHPAVATETSAATECDYSYRKPIPISGALCGIISDETGEPLPQVDVHLYAQSSVVATTRSDEKARFTFARIPAGEYRIGSTGFSVTGPSVFVTNARATRCQRQVEVALGVRSCSSNIWTGGGLRLRVKSSTPAVVSVDGSYEPPDEFNGDFELIALDPGKHRVEIEAEDYEPISFDVTTREFEPVTRTITLKRVKH